MFAGLDETEMALRQRQRVSRGSAPSTGISSARDCLGNERAMAFAADAIEDDAGDAHGRIVRAKTAHDRGCRLRLPRHVEHQHDRQAKMRGEIGGGAAAAGRSGAAAAPSNRPIDAFDHDDIGAAAPLARQARRAVFPTSPSYRD